MDRVILHADMNNCFASIELLHRPELRGRPLAVGGDPEARHGIVLAKDELAKARGVKTGMALWQARQLCPELVFVPPRMDLYLRFSRLAHEIYGSYTDRQEAFGVDESWLDVTGSCAHAEDGLAMAQDIRRRIKRELGITVSVGVSWNKIFAKLGSDYKKPDAVTRFGRDNYRELVYPLPASDLLYVGPKTGAKLAMYGICTIGQIARADPAFLHSVFGKMGYVLSAFARGEDKTPVNRENADTPVKSIGSSTTTPRDLVNEADVAIILCLLAESVAARLRENGFLCGTIEVSVRDCGLARVSWQKQMDAPTDITAELAAAAMELFQARCRWEKPIRSLGIRASALCAAHGPWQLSLFADPARRERRQRMDRAVDDIRRRFGFHSIQRGLVLSDRTLTAVNPREEHTVHPRGYMEFGNRTGAGAP